MGNITSRILKTEPVRWRGLEWLQTKNLKEMRTESYERLKNSIKTNHFIMPFNVWEDGGKIWILDGHHRQRVMQDLEAEGHTIPDLLPANFIRCDDRRQAVKLVLVYSSIYANVMMDGLYEMMSKEGISIDELEAEIEIPKINLDRFNMIYFEEMEPGYGEKEVDENIETNMECPQCGYKWKGQ